MLFILETPSLLIVSTGYNNGGYLKSTEVLNLGSEMTPSFQDNLKSLNGATGGWVGNGFIVCGGYDVDGEGYSKECHKIGKEETVKIGDMMMKRGYAASIVEGERIWILGGHGDSNSKTTSEFFSVNDGSSEQGPDLPIGLYQHTATKINTTTSIVIGEYRLGREAREARRPTTKKTVKTVKKSLQKKSVKKSVEKCKNCQKIFRKNEKMQKVAELAWLACQPKIRTT